MAAEPSCLEVKLPCMGINKSSPASTWEAAFLRAETGSTPHTTFVGTGLRTAHAPAPSVCKKVWEDEHDPSANEGSISDSESLASLFSFLAAYLILARKDGAVGRGGGGGTLIKSAFIPD